MEYDALTKFVVMLGAPQDWGISTSGSVASPSVSSRGTLGLRIARFTRVLALRVQETVVHEGETRSLASTIPVNLGVVFSGDEILGP